MNEVHLAGLLPSRGWGELLASVYGKPGRRGYPDYKSARGLQFLGVRRRTFCDTIFGTGATRDEYI